MSAKPTSDQMTRLTVELHGIVTDVTQESRQELVQIRDLIAQSIAVLDLSFSAIAVGTDVQKELVDKMLDNVAKDPEHQADLLEKLELNNEEIHANVAAAIRSLQFEDMVRQIVEHVEHRLDALDSITDALAGQAQTLEADRPHQHEHHLDQLNAHLSTAREALRNSDHRAVTQSSMDEGEIDLF